MNEILNAVKGKLGINRAIAYTTVARAIQAVGGFVTIFLVAHFMSQEEQGYYYTFNSILSIQMFVELGLGGIITQFIAHEFAFLRIKNNQIEGGETHLAKLASLTRFFAKWYVVAAFLLFVILFLIGFSFFQSYSTNDTIEWRLPWLILIIATSLNLLLSPLFGPCFPISSSIPSKSLSLCIQI